MMWSRCIDVDPQLGPVERWQRLVGNMESRAQHIAWVEAQWPETVVAWRLCDSPLEGL